MPTQSFALEIDGPKRLNISWRAQFNKVFLSLDGNTIGVVHDKKELSTGREFGLPDGSTIRIQLVNILTATELQVLRNGQPLPGSASHPNTRLKSAYQIMFWVAGVYFTISLSYIIFKSQASWLDASFPFLLLGFVFIALGFLVRRKSVAALLLAITTWSGIGIVAFVLEAKFSIIRVLIYLFPYIYFLIPMFLGFSAIQALQHERT